MKLAKPCIDVGLMTNNFDAMLAFWRDEVGLPYEELLKVGGGLHQHRLSLNGSVLKLNHARDPLPDTPPTGYRVLKIASDVSEERRLRDPDGNICWLVPADDGGITHIGLQMAVTNLKASRRFFHHTLQAENLGDNRYRWGTTVFELTEEPGAAGGGMTGRGYRYITVQVFKTDEEHQRLLAEGALEGRPPQTLGKTARISFVTDPDNNWIEVSQRASLTGDLSP